MKSFDLFIDNKPVKPRQRMTVCVPYDGQVFAEVPAASPDELEQAIAAARRAAPRAAETSTYRRYEILMRAAAALTEQQERFARIIALESGKPISEARTEAARAVQTLTFSAEEAKRIGGEVIPLDAHPGGAGRFGFTIRQPRGVVAAITPFNFPLNLVCHKVGPAIASGCSVVLKPASTTPLSAYMLAELLASAGLPSGFLNVVSGSGEQIGQQLVQHPSVNMITFTGSADVGKRIHRAAEIRMVTLELGSNSAVIIEPDCDLDLVVERCTAGGYAHSGQVCISLQRAYVHHSIRDEFLDRFRTRVEALQIGPPLEPTSNLTSLISPRDADRVIEWIEEARQGGARLLTGGQRQGRATVTPAILTDVAPSMRVVRQELFGPVVCVNSYRQLDEAIAMVNDSRLGLQAGIFTRDLGRALSAARRIEAGGVMINDVPTFRADHMPYGGTKDSGLGREGPRYACQEMTQTKMVVIRA